MLKIFVILRNATVHTKEEVVMMEVGVLNSLQFEMGNPTVKIFLRNFTALP